MVLSQKRNFRGEKGRKTKMWDDFWRKWRKSCRMNNCQAKAPPTTNRGKSNQNDVSLQNLKRVCGTDG